jgi:tetratricopeptide (TPR) repeat protein
MMRVAVLLVLLSFPAAIAGSQAGATDSDVLRGVVLAEAGDYDQAIDVLEGVVEAAPEKRRDSKDLALAYAYLGVACSAKGQDEKAKEMFATALGLDRGLVLSSPKVPSHARDLFESVKKQIPPRAEVKQGHRSSAPLIVLGLAAAGGGVYLLTRDRTSDAASNTKIDTFTGVIDYQQPSSSITLGPAKAGPWAATLSYEDPNAIFQVAVFSASSSVTNGQQNTATSLTASWNGIVGASYRIDWSLAKSVQKAKYTLTVSHPLP